MNGALYDRGSLPPELVIRSGTSLGLSPVCYVPVGHVRESPLLERHLACLGRAAATLGYSGFDVVAAADAVGSIDAPEAMVALVPTPADHRPGPPGGDWVAAAQPFVRPDASRPLRLGVSPYRRNHLSPTINALLLGDGELLQGTRLASADGRDDLVWLNLADAVSCAGSGALFAELDGRVVTPPLADGVPESAWREIAIAGVEAAERRLDTGDLRDAASAACLWPWGAAQPVAAIDDLSYHDGGLLAARITAATAATGTD